MGVFAKMKEVSASQGGVYVIPGVYSLEVDCLKVGKSRAGRDFFVAEFFVLESTNPERPVGCKMSWMVTLDPSYLETSLGNIKSFLSVLTSSPTHEVDEAAVEMAVSAANPCAGMKIKASAVNTKTKKGGDFTKVTWIPAE